MMRPPSEAAIHIGSPRPVGSDRTLAFEEFFEGEQERLLRVLSLVTGSKHEAEDITQDAFVRVWERWDSVAAMDEPAGYLHRTAMNVFRKRHRRTKLALRKAIGLEPERDVFQVVDDRDVVLSALASLTPRQRAAIVLTDGLGYTADEVGRMLGIRGSTVRAMKLQSRSRFAKEVLDA